MKVDEQIYYESEQIGLFSGKQKEKGMYSNQKMNSQRRKNEIQQVYDEKDKNSHAKKLFSFQKNQTFKKKGGFMEFPGQYTMQVPQEEESYSESLEQLEQGASPTFKGGFFQHNFDQNSLSKKIRINVKAVIDYVHSCKSQVSNIYSEISAFKKQIQKTLLNFGQVVKNYQAIISECFEKQRELKQQNISLSLKITALETQEKEIKKKYSKEIHQIATEYNQLAKNKNGKTYTIPNFSDLQFISSMNIEQKNQQKKLKQKNKTNQNESFQKNQYPDNNLKKVKSLKEMIKTGSPHKKYDDQQNEKMKRQVFEYSPQRQLLVYPPDIKIERKRSNLKYEDTFQSKPILFRHQVSEKEKWEISKQRQRSRQTHRNLQQQSLLSRLQKEKKLKFVSLRRKNDVVSPQMGIYHSQSSKYEDYFTKRTDKIKERLSKLKLQFKHHGTQ